MPTRSHRVLPVSRLTMLTAGLSVLLAFAPPGSAEDLPSQGSFAAPHLGNVASATEQDNVHNPTRWKHPPRPQLPFSRMFPGLPAFAPATDDVRKRLAALGAKGGVIDAKDQLNDPILSITTPGPDNPDNPNMTAGVTFLGQFLDHDITLDSRSPLLGTASPQDTLNFRTAAFDLDSVYGGGPDGSPELYDRSSGYIKLRIDEIPGSAAVSRHGAVRFDVPRDANNAALLGDHRNDENIIISQFHLAMLRFHNAVTDRVLAQYPGRSPGHVFGLAQRMVRWHYQWIILHEFLPLTIGQDRVDDLMRNGLKFYDPHSGAGGNPRIPVEFAVAAYRFGHSQVRPSYRVNFGPDGGPAVFRFVFDDTQDPSNPDPNDLRGGKRAPSRFVDWQTFFKFDEINFRPNKRIDGKLSSVLMNLPGSRAPAPGLPDDGVQSLPARNMLRHLTFGLPSGQAVARKIGAPPLTPAQLYEYSQFGFADKTPLWLYVLKESEVVENGLRLGPVGSRIVGEVFIGLLKADKSSFLSAQPTWKPTLPSATPEDFRVTDLLNFAGVVPPL